MTQGDHPQKNRDLSEPKNPFLDPCHIVGYNLIYKKYVYILIYIFVVVWHAQYPSSRRIFEVWKHATCLQCCSITSVMCLFVFFSLFFSLWFSLLVSCRCCCCCCFSCCCEAAVLAVVLVVAAVLLVVCVVVDDAALCCFLVIAAICDNLNTCF